MDEFNARETLTLKRLAHTPLHAVLSQHRLIQLCCSSPHPNPLPAILPSYLWVFSCALQAAGSEKALLHSRQEKGFSPVWMRT